MTKLAKPLSPVDVDVLRAMLIVAQKKQGSTIEVSQDLMHRIIVTAEEHLERKDNE